MYYSFYFILLLKTFLYFCLLIIMLSCQWYSDSEKKKQMHNCTNKLRIWSYGSSYISDLWTFCAKTLVMT